MNELLITLFRTIFLYFFIIFLYRIMGKREVGELSIIDLIISILIAELTAISIENTNVSLVYTILPLISLVILEMIISFIGIKSRKFRAFFDGKPSLIVVNGKINYKEMVKQRYSIDDLLLSLRQKEIDNILDVSYAFLEHNGKLSVFKKNKKNNYPMPIIIDGEINYKALDNIGMSENTLKINLSHKDILLKDVFYAFYKNKKLFIINKNNLV